MDVEQEIYSLLGLHEKEQRVQSGLLAEGTMAQIRDAIARLLINRGIEASEVLKVFLSFIFKFQSSSSLLKYLSSVIGSEFSKMKFSIFQLGENPRHSDLAIKS